ncbi:MAG: hypothetical protein WKF79_00520, partial [Nocardioides sp.]
RDGPRSSPGGLVLSPPFAEALLNWPAGWTAFDFSGEAWTHWSRLMRGCLSTLGSAPPPDQERLL